MEGSSQVIKVCENCNVNKAIKLGKYSKTRFCSKVCSRSFSTKNDKKDERKIVNCIICNNQVEVNKRTNPKIIRCENCGKSKVLKKVKTISLKNEKSKKLKSKKLKSKPCKLCGNNKEYCQRKELCNKHRITKTLIQYFGFNKEIIGTEKFFNEFDKTRDKIFDLYNNGLSLNKLAEEVGYPHGGANLWNTLKSLDLTYRNLSDAGYNALLLGVSKPVSSFNYKQGWHTTWDGRKVYYRSSYELEYFKQLDERKVNYEVEKLRIEYWDDKRCRFRIAIPDVYLPDINTIIEIKSFYFLDKENMSSKVKKYKELGYDFKLILEKDEVDFV